MDPNFWDILYIYSGALFSHCLVFIHLGSVPALRAPVLVYTHPWAVGQRWGWRQLYGPLFEKWKVKYSITLEWSGIILIISHERELAVSCRYVKNFLLTILHLHGDDENIVSDLISSFHMSNFFSPYKIYWIGSLLWY